MRDLLDERAAIVRGALDHVHTASVGDQVAAIAAALDKGGLFVIAQDLYLTRSAEKAHVVLPAAAWGESPITSINGERRLRLYEQIQDPPGEAMPELLRKLGHDGIQTPVRLASGRLQGSVRLRRSGCRCPGWRCTPGGQRTC
jgi:NADH dehydrogenase/NADH:ubiquinone oxidoreductase subunit G